VSVLFPTVHVAFGLTPEGGFIVARVDLMITNGAFDRSK